MTSTVPLSLTRTSFHRQLLLIFSVGIIFLALVASVTTAWVTSQQVRTLLVTEGLQVTENLAEQSVLALLYDSGDNALDAARTTLSFPAIQRVTIFNARHQPILAQQKSKTPGLGLEQLQWVQGGAALIEETARAWHFMAPVYVEADPLPAALATERELLGHVYVVMHKDTLYEIQTATFINNIAIAVFIAAILLLLLNLSLTRLTDPLHTLSRLMEQAQQGKTEVYARVHGPQEVTQIAAAFNTMMESLAERDKRLREHNLRLESEVSLRTRELVQTRDAALAASRHKSEFLANISHELRTPLQSIIGYTDVVIENMEDEGQDIYLADLERVLHNAYHLLSLIDGTLALAKIEAGRMELDIQDVNLETVLAQAEETIKPLMKANNNRLETQLDSNGNMLRIDAGKLLQILLNLLSNAAKFTHDGEVTMHVKHSNLVLVIDIEDTGIGIGMEQQAIIFDPFQQGDGSVTRNFQGTGLGLSITHRFCQLMGGDIRVVSTPGQGATFTVTIPLPVTAEGMTGSRKAGDTTVAL